MRAAFLFDMDGVIVDSNPYHKIALKSFCKKHGKDLGEDELREKIYGRTNKDWLKNLFGEIEPATLAKYADEKEQLFRDLFQHDIKLVDGLKDFLETMELQQIPKAIATSAPKTNVDFTLTKTASSRYFSTILDESFVTRGKPDPEIYLKTAAALGMNPKDCIVIEDSLSGIEAGKRAGCKVIGITTTHSKEELGADLVIDNFVGLDPQQVIDDLFGYRN